MKQYRARDLIRIILIVVLLAAMDRGVARASDETRATAWLRQHREDPVDYVVRQFRHADIVLLGEDHRVRQNLLFVQQLIPRLHAAGISMLGMEFGAVEDQAALDALVTGRDYDEAAARRIMFGYDTSWAYREYLDVYRAAWAFNRRRPAGSRAFRILNLSYRYNWRAAGPVLTPARAAMIFARGPIDAFRARRIKTEILDRRQKMLALVGTIHATTHYAARSYDYNAPNFVREDRRHLGNLLLAMRPGRVRSILLHQPFPSADQGGIRLVQPAGGAIERMMRSLDDQPSGFDLVGSPVGALADTSLYAAGRTHFELAALADGYVFLAPFAALTGCTIDRQFVTEETWAEARDRFAVEIRQRPASIAEYWRSVETYGDVRAAYAAVR